jgi:hypothetical protein
VCIVHRYLRNSFDPILDSICEMWDHLHGLSEVVSPPLALDHMLVDLARCDVILSRQCDVQISLVVPKIEVDLSAII